MILMQKRKSERTQMKFSAALKGINLDDDTQEEDSVEAKLEEVKRRAAVRLKGELEVEREEFAEIGFGFEVDSD